MLDREQKRAKYNLFIESTHFGLATYNTLYLFNVNISYLIETVRIYNTLIGKLGTPDFPTDHDEAKILRLRQFVMLDMISRVTAGIESVLVMVDELSKGYTHLASGMSYYEPKRPRDIIKKILRKKNPYPMRKVMGLPHIDQLGLTKEERNLLGRLYAETEERIIFYLKRLARFYDRYRILYGKHKHGLTLEAGSGFDNYPILPSLEDSFLVAYDHKSLDDMPAASIVVKEKDIAIGNWFNAQSALKFNMAANQELWETIAFLKDVVSYITWNHIDYALNCGEGYLPWFAIDNNRVSFWFFTQLPLGEEDSKLAQSIMDKLLPKMNIGRRNLHISREFDNALLKSLVYDSVTNMWFKSK